MREKANKTLFLNKKYLKKKILPGFEYFLTLNPIYIFFLITFFSSYETKQLFEKANNNNTVNHTNQN